MITRFHIENFKSLVDFDLPPAGCTLPQFTCLIGLNGSGKSTLLQAMDFAAHVIAGQVVGWLQQRNWNVTDVLTGFGKRTFLVNFDIGFSDPNLGEVTWKAKYNATRLQCTWERVESAGQTLLELEADRLALAGPDGQLPRSEEKHGLAYMGSVLSVLQLKDRHPGLALVKDSLQGLKSLELLSPQLLRKRAYAAEDIGLGGEKLSAFLAGLTLEKRAALLKALRRFHPQLEVWWVKSLRAGWKDLWIVERYAEKHAVPAMQMNDGLLRAMAILAQAHSPHSFLLLDEIENGMHPEVVEGLVDFLIHCGKQVIVTTHSPMILNYIPDEVAREGVVMLYRTRRGETKSARFFDLPAMQEKLKVLGPGEVFADTRLSELARELERSGNDHPAAATAP